MYAVEQEVGLDLPSPNGRLYIPGEVSDVWIDPTGSTLSRMLVALIRSLTADPESPMCPLHRRSGVSPPQAVQYFLLRCVSQSQNCQPLWLSCGPISDSCRDFTTASQLQLQICIWTAKVVANLYLFTSRHLARTKWPFSASWSQLRPTPDKGPQRRVKMSTRIATCHEELHVLCNLRQDE